MAAPATRRDVLLTAPTASDPLAVGAVLTDAFVTTRAAPLASPRLAEPGPGTGTIQDTGNKLTTAGGQLQSSGFTAGGDPRLVYGPFTRVAGLALRWTCTWITPHSGGGWCTTATPTTYPTLGVSDVAGIVTLVPPVQAGFTLFTTGVTYDILVILRGTGAWFVVRGGLYTDWTLLWVDANTATATLWAVPVLARTTDAQMRVSPVDVVQLSGGWTKDYGPVVARALVATTSMVLTGQPDGIAEFTWTPAAGETLDLSVRQTDTDNRWIARCSQAGGTVKLYSRIAGVETQSATGSLAFTVGTAYRIVVWYRGATIRVFAAATNTGSPGLLASSTTATFNQTATGVAATGWTTGKNLVAWPSIVPLLPGTAPGPFTVATSRVAGLDLIQ